jgi:uncharacterized membrane protein YdjX (TVP38/TMEM64 family)
MIEGDEQIFGGSSPHLKGDTLIRTGALLVVESLGFKPMLKGTTQQVQFEGNIRAQARIWQWPLSFGRQHTQKLIGFVFWLVLIVGYWWYSRQNQLSPGQAIQQLFDLSTISLYGPLIYILAYAIRPLTFVPSALLSVAAGYLFGPIIGVIYGVIGSNASAIVAYLVGRYFGQGLLESKQTSNIIQRYADRLRRNGFEILLTMRFLFLPYDLISYLSGFLRIDWKVYALATALGGLPGMMSFVFFGASIEGAFGFGQKPDFNPWVLGASAALFIVSLGLARYFKRREKRVR